MHTQKTLIGVQLYGSTRLYKEDPDLWLASLAEAGFDALEPCVRVDGEELSFAWELSELPSHAERAKKAGLSLLSCHLFTADLERAVPACVRLSEEYGFQSFVTGLSGDLSRERLDSLAKKTRKAGKALREAGLSLWLHNNAPEIREKTGGISAYEYLLRASDGFLGAQVDTGWVACGGEEVMPFLERNREYVRSIHHKDVSSLSSDPVNVALGRGTVDPKGPFDFALSRGLYQVVDQDNSRADFLGDLRASVRLLRSFSGVG